MSVWDIFTKTKSLTHSVCVSLYTKSTKPEVVASSVEKVYRCAKF